ncbi:Metallo-dependent hydrolase, partial [Aureobasidium melanogenum]
MHARILTIMATRAQDQELVADTADKLGVKTKSEQDWSSEQKVIPCFGWHPWFSHQMFDEETYPNTTTLTPEQKIEHYQSALTPTPTDRDFLLALPEPRPFSVFLNETKRYLQKYPLALIGEVGLDKQFRIPEAWLPGQKSERDEALTPGGREGRSLSPYRVSMDHQKKVLLAQLHLAGELGRATSVHGVRVLLSVMSKKPNIQIPLNNALATLPRDIDGQSQNCLVLCLSPDQQTFNHGITPSTETLSSYFVDWNIPSVANFCNQRKTWLSFDPGAHQQSGDFVTQQQKLLIANTADLSILNVQDGVNTTELTTLMLKIVV